MADPHFGGLIWVECSKIVIGQNLHPINETFSQLRIAAHAKEVISVLMLLDCRHDVIFPC